ncbi:MAG: hypothetical protein IIY21_10880 [Clostridiales bacterium]|nr:hypothetical protein [Clostridiales bacterium]MBQ1571188.1 hypothetical protein [Clostridiales bacterium]
MNKVDFGFQLLDLSDLTGNGRTFKAGIFDRVKKAVTGHKKSFFVKGRNDQHYVISNADVFYISEAQQYRIMLPIDVSGTRQIVFIENTDYYRVVTTAVADVPRPTVQAISILNANFSIATGETEQQIVLTGNDGITNGAYMAQLARQGKIIPGDGMLVSIAGKITDVDKSIDEEFFRVEVPCYVEGVNNGNVSFEYNLRHSVDTDIPVYVTGQKYYIRGSYWKVGADTEITLLLYPAI